MRTQQQLLEKYARFGFLLISLVVSHAEPAGNVAGKIRVLFVGNSYTYADDIPWITKQLATAAGGSQTLEVEMIAPMGETLQGHWEKGEVVRRLHESKWNYVVLQEQSTRPIEQPEITRKYARLLDSEIKSAGAKTILFVTWPRQQHLATITAITNTFFNLAKELNAIVAPVGGAWVSVTKEKPSLALYHQDGSHPNAIGSYLASCVLYSILFEKSPVGLSHTLYTARGDGSHVTAGSLNETDALLIQNSVWQCVQNMQQPK